MKTIFKRIISMISAIIFVLTLSACSSSNSTSNNSETNFTESQEVLVKPTVKYTEFSVSEELKLPFEQYSMLGSAQVEKDLYVLGGGAVYKINLETAETSKLFETAADMIASDGSEIVLAGSDSALIYLYSLSGEKEDEFSVEELQAGTIKGMCITDDYYVLLVNYTNNNKITPKIISINKSDHLVKASKELKNGSGNICAYKNNEVLLTYVNNQDDQLLSYNADENSTSKLRNIMPSARSIDCMALTYNKKADTAILLELSGNGETRLCEYSLDSEDNLVLKKLKGVSGSEICKLTIYENIISLTASGSAGYMYFDYNDPPKSITIAYFGGSQAQNIDIETIISGYEQEHDIIIRTVCYNDDLNRLNLKLMAQDTDIDIYSTIGVDEYKYIKNHMYVSLDDYDIGKKLSGNVFADFATKFNGDHIGIPYGVMYQKDAHKSVTGFNAIEQYCITNVNTLEGIYKDQDGKEFSKILKYHYDNPSGSDKEPYDFDYSTVQTDYLIINPASVNIERSAEFLEYCYDALLSGEAVLDENGQTNSKRLMMPYIQLETADDVYLTWQFKTDDILDTLYEAYRSCLNTDGSTSEIKKLAQSAAKELAMRIGE